MEIFLIGVLFIIIAIIAWTIRAQNKKLIDAFKALQVPDERVDTRELTSYELLRLKREEDFDARINMIKNELAKTRADVHKATVADELHPMVHNLPHSVIDNKLDYLPDVEVSQ